MMPLIVFLIFDYNHDMTVPEDYTAVTRGLLRNEELLERSWHLLSSMRYTQGYPHVRVPILLLLGRPQGFFYLIQMLGLVLLIFISTHLLTLKLVSFMFIRQLQATGD